MTDDAATSRLGRDRVPMTAGQVSAEARAMGRAVRELGPARALFIVGAWAFVACVLIQVFLVGLDLFAKTGSSIHRDFAYIFGWLVPIFVGLSRMPRVPHDTRVPALLLLVLFAAQTVLPSLRDQYPVLAAIHPVNALAIFAVGIILARRVSAGIAFRGRPASA